ncbi:MAG TPA: efflux RND transporter periplasmic adaptor subunit [Bryobacteraceae bacterium]|nr:efflux RND transporter periplasmic adaptor subunit [Bryobacteraceae bacterium]
MTRAARWLCVLTACGFLTAAGCSKGGSTTDTSQSDSTQAAASESGGSNQSQAGAGGAVKIEPNARRNIGLQVIRVQPRTVPEYLTAAGQIVMDEEKTVHIGVYASGRITELHANVGDFADRGEVLARMHSHDVHETRAAYDSALQEVQRQQQMVEYQRRMRDRIQRLLALKSASPQELEKAQSDLRSAETSVRNAQISVNKEAEHLSDILGLPKSQLGHLTEITELVPVISPINGTVVDRKVTLGTVVDPGMEVYTVSDLTSVWMMASVNETDIENVRVGDAAEVTSHAYPDKVFKGRVTRLGPQFDPQTRTLMVRITVPNPRAELRPAMYATAQINKGQSHRAIFVPAVAIQNINGSSVVFLEKPGNIFTAQPVDIARRIDGQAEISNGLNAGDSVVTQGSFVVKSEVLKSQIGE